MKKIAYLVLILFFMVSCKEKAADTGHEETHREAETHENTDMQGTESPGFEQLCQKLVDEMKVMGTPEVALDQTRGACLKAADAYQGKVASAEAFVHHILDTCEGKSGENWFACYNAEAQNAAQKAAAADNMSTSAVSTNHQTEHATDATDIANHESHDESAKTGNYTFDALCDKLSDEMGGMGAPAANIDQSRQACKQGGAAFAQNKTMMETYVKHVMTACEGKSGQDWFTCYSTEAQVAAQKMAGM